MADENGARNRDKGLLNGSSLSRLTGAQTSAKLQVEVRMPATSMAELLETIERYGKTGSLQVNFSHGKARDMKWSNTIAADAPDI